MSPCSSGRTRISARGGGVYVPFGGGEHDWAALELGGWLASATASPLRLVGTRADPRRGRRDASRLLADASLAVQRVVGVETEPVLAEPSEDGLLQRRRDGGHRRRRHLAALAARGHRRQQPRARPRGTRPTLLVHRGLRPGGLAPRESRTRFTWTLDAASR